MAQAPEAQLEFDAGGTEVRNAIDAGSMLRTVLPEVSMLDSPIPEATTFEVKTAR